jgi:hypothetical protein
MTAVVFAGPSVHGVAAGELTGTDLRPPAGCGDLARAVRDGARVVALVDGVFETAPAPWHKEILWALSKGVAVYGASSIGALRAAEMHRFGMRGVGRIFRLYRSGAIIDDDEVALAHGPRELAYVPLTEAMINVRATMRLARRQGIIAEATEAAIVAAAKRIFYKERTYPEIFKRAARDKAKGVHALERWAATNARDVKRDDALRLVGVLRGQNNPSPIKPTFVRTTLWSVFEETYLGRRER